MPGFYRFRISTYAYHSDRPITTAVYAGNKLVGYYDVPPDPNFKLDITIRLKQYATLKAVPYGLKWGKKDYDKDPGLALKEIEIEGPLYDTWPHPEYQQLIGNVDLKKGTLEDVERIVRAFATRAFRRPVRDAELRPFLDLASDALRDPKAGGFENALRTALAGVLCSPHFLFLREKLGKLDDFALASRLSYFLWSTMPDDELIQAAGAGRLSQPDVLRAQVERMLNSPRAAAFTENFLGQWLELRRIDATTPDNSQFPQFDDLVRHSVLRETHGFFDEILKNDLSVLNFIDSDFVVINRPLAKLYGLPDVDSVNFRKVSLPPGSHRGGVLTQASVLKITANGTTTSPVLRGVWVLKNVLGQRVPPPPPNIPAIEPDIRGATSIREQLAKHRQIESCAACHTKIDPIGFALENFDVVGGWRDNYRSKDPKVNKFIQVVTVNTMVHRYRIGLPVDSADVLADGRRFRDIDELKKLLLSDPDSIARGLTEKLAIYATGGTVGESDAEAITAIVQRLRARKYGLRTLVHELVQSELFLNK
jgi:hypothetical protein